ncbi:hypothetical protein ACFL1M_00100 [Patescibacteria group bacterium]
MYLIHSINAIRHATIQSLMHSHLIISPSKQALEIASQISPQEIKSGIDVFISNDEGSLGIEAIRNLKIFLQKKPFEKDYQIVYIESAERLTVPAQNSLLKTLEEPPPNCIIFLTTTSSDKLLPTVISRCQIHRNKREIKKVDNSNDFKTTYKEILSSSVSQKVSIAQEHAYPKDKTKILLQNAIELFRKMLYQNPTNEIKNNLKIAQKSLLRIQQNVDPRLTIEHFFINLS